MFTICLFMFWLHTVVLSKTRKLQFTNSLLVRLHIIIETAAYRFHKINSSRHNNIRGFKIRYYNAKILYKDDLEFVTEFPCLLGHPGCIAMGEINLDAQFLELCELLNFFLRLKNILYLNNHCSDGSDNRFCPGCVSAPTPAPPTLPLW